MKTVLVSSIKGGTGKSIISINLALRLAEKGYEVGLLDADIESSYFAEYTKVNEIIDITQDVMKPVIWNNVKVFSMSLLVGKERAVSMYGFSERQLLNDVKKHVVWGNLDYMVIDMPSGAGDVFKEVIELWSESLVGGLIVIIPMAELAARRLIKLYKNNEVPIVGIIENMAYFKCPSCGKEFKVFGDLTGKKLSETFNIKYLGAIPLDPRIPENIARGNPVIPDDIAKPIYRAIEVIESMPAGSFYEKFKKKFKEYVKESIIKVLVKLIVSANKSFNIKTLQDRYGFKKGYPVMLAVTDERGKLLVALVMRVKDGKLVVVKKKVEPKYIIEVPVKTLAQLLLGYRTVNGERRTYDVYDAWLSGDLKVYGEGSTPMLLYVAKTLLSDENVVKNVRSKFKNFIELLAGD